MNRTKTLILLVIGMGIVALGVYLSISRPQSRGITYENVTIGQALALIEVNPSVIRLDVRTTLEFESGHLAGAMNIPVGELGQKGAS